MKLMVDTNVILDVWLAREPFWQDSARLLAKLETNKAEGYICPTTITTLHYLGRKTLGERNTRELLESLLSICKIGKLSSKIFKEALSSEVKDFEDAVIEAVSLASKVDAIATRNIKDYKHSRIPVLEPAAIVRAE